MNLTRIFASRRSMLRLCAAASIVLCTGISTAANAAYPDKPLKLVVPYPPGGATDVIGRIIASRLSESLGQQVIVENRSGAGGNIGAEAVARAPADGYTLLMGALTSHATIATLEKGKLRYNLIKDFVPVMVVGAVPLVVVVNPGLPVKNLGELVAWGKANPDKLTYASSGPGAPQRMAAEILRKEAGIRMIHVPYKGSGPAMVDLVGGQVNLMAETVPAALQFIKAGQLRALAVTTKERISMLPDVPTTAEAGLPEVEVSSTFGVLAPAGTPKDIVERLNATVAGIVAVPEVREQFLGQGVYAAAPTTSEQSAARLNQEVERWAKVITESNIQPD